MTVVDRAYANGALEIFVGFQSLLLWMTVVDKQRAGCPYRFAPSFNPCCCG